MTNTTQQKGHACHGAPSTTPRADYKQSCNFKDPFSLAIWRSAYAMEEARQDHADAGHLWRQAGCCIALSFFRMVGGRGV